MTALRHRLQWLFALALFAAGYAVLFRRWLFTGFDGIFGDEGDGQILLALVEHWRRVFSGLTHWSDPIFFVPQRGVLGYSDAYFLYGLIHAPLRFLGFDTFTAFMLVMSLLAVLGYFGFYALARRYVAIPAPWAAVGAALFAFANMDAMKLVQAQSYCAMLLPLVCLLVLTAWTAPRRMQGLACAAGAGLLHALIFFTAFQTAWFFTLLLIFFALLAPLVLGLPRVMMLVRDAVGPRRLVLLAYAAAFAAGIVPFLALYVPVLQAGYSRDLAEVFSNAPDWRDILNVTPENWVWGKTMSALGFTGRPNRPVWEVEMGYTPLVAAMFCMSMIGLLWRWPRGQERERWLLLLGIGVFVLWLLEIEYGGYRPWGIVWSLVPGAGAVRYVFRSQLVANLFVSMVVAAGLAWLCARPLRRWMRLALFACAAFLLVEQVNADWPATISRRARSAWLAAIPAPPPACRIFYLVPNVPPHDREGWIHQADAMMIAHNRNWPTINGYSTWLPRGWDLEEPSKPGYAAAVRDWAARNKLDGLCGLDPANDRWTVGLP